MYGVSYSTRYDEVKIHSGSCRFTINQSQKGTTKWENHGDLADSVRAANRLSSGPNRWRYAQCCLRHASYIYECLQCRNLTRGKRFVKKSAFGMFIFFTIGLSIITAITLPVFAPNLYSQYGTSFVPALFMLGVIITPIIYYAHPKRCSYCKTKNFR